MESVKYEAKPQFNSFPSKEALTDILFNSGAETFGVLDLIFFY
jgi:hypothetical protein